jgi:Putative addiction module component.
MTLREQLLEQALTLPTADQAFLAQSLEDHLIAHTPEETAEADGASGSELQTELRRRSAAYRSGQSTARLASDVLSDMRQRQVEKRAN